MSSKKGRERRSKKSPDINFLLNEKSKLNTVVIDQEV